MLRCDRLAVWLVVGSNEKMEWTVKLGGGRFLYSSTMLAEDGHHASFRIF